MLKEALEKMMEEGGIPLVWGRPPHVPHPKFKNSPRNDGKDPIGSEQQEADVDELEADPMDDAEGMEDMEDMEDIEGGEEFGDLDDESDDPDRQGLIRVVPDAHLVFKRTTEEGTFDELWIYNTGDEDFNKELEIRRAILSGTDIPKNKMSSPDGSQSYDLWSVGNAQMIHITGLPS